MNNKLKKIFAVHKPEQGELISILQDIQEEIGWLPKNALLKTAEFLKMPPSRVFGVVTFYTQFHITCQGRHKIRVCRGTACQVRGSAGIMEAISRKIGIKPGETSKDFEFSLERVACVGSCALAPLIVVDGKVYGKVTVKDAEDIIDGIRRKQK